MNVSSPPFHGSFFARHRLSAAIAFTLAALAAAPALAQQSGTADGTNAGSTNSDIVELPRLEVTAQKRKEDESNVPSSITAVGAQQLQDQHVTELKDLSGFIPSLQIQDGSTPGQSSIAIRGIQTLGPGAVIGTYVDDVPVSSSSNFARASLFVLDLLPDDIQRIEVLRGPQGTLYGATAMGGLLKYVTVDPDFAVRSGHVNAGISDLSGGDGLGWTARAGVNLPLSEQFAVRASLAQERTPGWIDDVVLGRKGINSTDQRSGRLALRWKMSERVEVKLSSLHQSIDARDTDIVTLDPVSLKPFFGADATHKPVAEPFKKTIDLQAATVDWDLNWADFISATSYSKTSTSQVGDASSAYGLVFPQVFGIPAGISQFDLDLGLKKWTQEFRLASKSEGRLEWLVGAFYTHEQSSNAQRLSAQSADGAPIPGLDPLLHAELPSIYREQALFGDLTYRFSDRFDVTLGLRYAQNEQDYRQILLGGVLSPAAATHNTSSEDVTTYLFAPRFWLSRDMLLYGRVASGYRPGGPNIVLPNVPPTVNSDTLTNYELGFKSFFWNGRASFDMAAYQIDWKDIQLAAAAPNGITYFANAGTATTRGLEWIAEWQATRNLQLGFNASYTDAFLTKDAPSFGGVRGDTMLGIPDWSASLRAEYALDLANQWSARLGLGYGWYGTRNTYFEHSRGNFALSSIGELSAFASFTRNNLTFRLYGKNLTDSKDYLNLTLINNLVTGAPVEVQSTRPVPRTIGVEVDVGF